MNLKIKLTDQPREKLLNHGVTALTDSELLALILRSGGSNNSVLELSNSLLAKFNGLKGLVNTDLPQLIDFKNIGLAKAAGVKAACEIGLRIAMGIAETKLEIKKPEDVYNCLRKDLYEKNKEHLYLLSLDARSRLIAKNLLSIGTINETLVHPREIFRQALINNAASIILVHNHPSGDTNPSTDDIVITERIYKVGIEMGVALVDHIIISNSTYVSLKAFNLLRKEVNK